MPRNARKKSESGIYHIILRGSNRQEIFHDEVIKKIMGIKGLTQRQTARLLGISANLVFKV